MERWTDRQLHREWLWGQAEGLWDFFQRGFVDPSGGFFDLAPDGRPLDAEGQVHPIHIAARAVHCFAIGDLLGRPGSSAVVDHGMEMLWHRHRDRENGGYFWSVRQAPEDRLKQGYGHAFVLLAASSARLVGHPLADPMLEDITGVLNSRFWEPRFGAIAEEFTADWQPLEGGAYRGQNSNMHLTEALMAAYEATGDADYLAKARSIAERVIGQAARACGWRVGEHFTADWQLDRDYYHPNEMFRPAGTTPGHSLELGRLVIQHWDLAGRPEGDAVTRARRLIEQALADAWLPAGGIAYTLKLGGGVDIPDRYWWPVTEAIGALASLIKVDPQPQDEAWYRRLWAFADGHFIDHAHGGWFPEIDTAGAPTGRQFLGKPDIYHALQAELFPLAPGVARHAAGLAALPAPA